MFKNLQRDFWCLVAFKNQIITNFKRDTVKYFFKGIFLLICLSSFMSLSTACVSDSSTSTYQAKLYFNTNDLEIADNVIYIHLENTWIETKVIRTDQEGLYIFENDITDSSVGREREQRWKCPYCYSWWPIGQKCKNPDCPTNKW